MPIRAAASAESALTEYRFGLSLFHEGDTHRAITAWKRARFLDPEGPAGKAAALGVGIAYYKNEEFDLAAQAFRRAGSIALEGQSLLGAGRLEEARGLLSPAKDDLSGLILAWTYLAEGRGRETREIALKIPENSDLANRAEILSAKALESDGLPSRKPVLGAILSAIIPGLGQWVSGRFGDGLSALVVNGLFAWGAVEAFESDRPGLGVLASAVGAGWYAGNIHAGANAAVRWNRERRSDFLEEAWRQSGPPDMEKRLFESPRPPP